MSKMHFHVPHMDELQIDDYPDIIAEECRDLKQKLEKIEMYEELDRMYNDAMRNMKVAQDQNDIESELQYMRIIARCKHALDKHSYIQAWDKKDIMQQEIDLLIGYIAFS